MNLPLARLLLEVQANDTNYADRYSLVLRSVSLAHLCGYKAGFGIDRDSGPDMDGFRVVAYIELPEVGQVSWHLPEHPHGWDGHSTPQKFERIERYAAIARGSVAGKPGGEPT